MQEVFAGLSEKVIRKPVFTVFIAVLVMIALVTGVTRIRLSTGNETFIGEGTDIYRNNRVLEEMFGGENILVRLETEDMEKLLTVENLALLSRLEEALLQNSNVFTVVGPATAVKHMTAKQAETIIGNVSDMRAGLAEMSVRLADLSYNITGMAGRTPVVELTEVNRQFAQSSQALDKLIAGQQQLHGGIGRLESAYSEFGGLVSGMAASIAQISAELDEAMQNLPIPEQEKQQVIQKVSGLVQSAAALEEAGTKMEEIGGKARLLGQVPLQAATGLAAMQEGLSAQSGRLQMMQQQRPDIGNLGGLADGLAIFSEKLKSVSAGLGSLLDISDIMAPGLPGNQSTLDRILYDNGELRPIFEQMIIGDTNMLIMVRLSGNTSDSRTEEVAGLIADFFTRNPLSHAEVTVTGRPVLDTALRTNMKKSMQRMVLSALVLMVVIVSLVFKVRWRLFPLAVNFAAVVATMGLMGHIGIPMTMVSMAAFPILIGLGIDYSIQFHSRYEEELISGEAQSK